jgi:hypothetical protein
VTRSLVLSIFRLFLEIYYTIYVLFFRLFRLTKMNSEALASGYAMGLVTAVQIVFLFGVSCWWEILARERIPLSKLELALVFAPALLFNYWLINRANGAALFEKQFETLTSQRVFFLRLSAVCCILAAIIFSQFSVSEYHRVFHIASPAW